MSLYEKLINQPEVELVQLITQSKSISEVLRKVGFASNDRRAWKYIKKVMIKHDISLIIRRNHSYSYMEVVKAITDSICMTEVLEHLGLQPHGGNANTIKKIINDNNIDITHFNTKEARLKNRKVWKYEEVFCVDSLVPRSTLAKHVKKFKLLEYKCNECGNTGIWNKKVLTLTVDHINGRNKDNRPENLQYLCPNCHSQTNTFGNKTRIAGLI